MEKKSKTVEMSRGKVNQASTEKLTYEQLEQVARDLNMQCRQLQAQLGSAQRVIGEFNDLGMLLSIIGKSEYFNDSFIERCVNRVEKLVTEALDGYDETETENKAIKEESKDS